ncbi:MAG: Uncharacterized MFS-type transporter, partial [uncultured Rubrobacteraceae bacterium]
GTTGRRAGEEDRGDGAQGPDLRPRGGACAGDAGLRRRVSVAALRRAALRRGGRGRHRRRRARHGDVHADHGTDAGCDAEAARPLRVPEGACGGPALSGVARALLPAGGRRGRGAGRHPPQRRGVRDRHGRLCGPYRRARPSRAQGRGAGALRRGDDAPDRPLQPSRPLAGGRLRLHAGLPPRRPLPPARPPRRRRHQDRLHRPRRRGRRGLSRRPAPSAAAPPGPGLRHRHLRDRRGDNVPPPRPPRLGPLLRRRGPPGLRPHEHLQPPVGRPLRRPARPAPPARPGPRRRRGRHGRPPAGRTPDARRGAPPRDRGRAAAELDAHTHHGPGRRRRARPGQHPLERLLRRRHRRRRLLLRLPRRRERLRPGLLPLRRHPSAGPHPRRRGPPAPQRARPPSGPRFL